MDFLYTYSYMNWALIFLGAFFIGLSKAGLKGVDMMNVTIMAIVFGSKASTGIVLPLLWRFIITTAMPNGHIFGNWCHG
jgi:hypothetical protein